MIPGSSLIEVFSRALSAVKRIEVPPQCIDSTSYLGGDLGIDSIEMLEIWYRMEKELELRVPDLAKRDIYTVSQVLDVLTCYLDSAVPQIQ